MGTAIPGAIITRCCPATRVPDCPRGASPTSAIVAGGGAGSLTAATAVVEAAADRIFDHHQADGLRLVDNMYLLLPQLLLKAT
jgi:hypothetical protein